MTKRNANITLKARINSDILKWARQAINVSPDYVVEKIKRKSVSADDLLKWENGQDYPTIQVAKKLATIYGIKFITLYLPRIPKNIKPLKDFRSGHRDPFTREFVFLMREIQGKQEWVKEYLLSKNRKPIDFVGSIDISFGIAKTVEKIKNILFCRELNKKADASLKALIKRMESLGVFVSIANSFNCHHAHVVGVLEARGFAISDNIAPFIFINSKDAKTGQLFTLIHEFCHLLLGETGISDIFDDSNNNIEVFCNRVAAEFLMPSDKFRDLWKKEMTTDDKIQVLSNEFPVSKLAIIIRVRSLNLIEQSHYERLYNAEQKAISDALGIKKSQKGGMADVYREKLKINGRPFVDTVISAYNNDEIAIGSACSLLGISNIKKFDEYEKKWVSK